MGIEIVEFLHKITSRGVSLDKVVMHHLTTGGNYCLSSLTKENVKYCHEQLKESASIHHHHNLYTTGSRHTRHTVTEVRMHVQGGFDTPRISKKPRVYLVVSAVSA